jgi:hypothetical protein
MADMSDDVSEPDIQRFDRDGIWRKPPGAVSVDIYLKGGDGGPGLRVIPARALTLTQPGGGGSGGRPGGTVISGSGGTCMTGAGGGGGTGGAVVAEVGTQAAERGWAGSSGAEGELVTLSYAADVLPDEVPIQVGKGGRPGGRDGYALIFTHVKTSLPARVAPAERAVGPGPVNPVGDVAAGRGGDGGGDADQLGHLAAQRPQLGGQPVEPAAGAGVHRGDLLAAPEPDQFRAALPDPRPSRCRRGRAARVPVRRLGLPE